MNEKNPMRLWGIPIVVVDEAPKGKVILGRLPTWQEVVEAGSFEEAVKKLFGKVKIEDGQIPTSTPVE